MAFGIIFLALGLVAMMFGFSIIFGSAAFWIGSGIILFVVGWAICEAVD